MLHSYSTRFSLSRPRSSGPFVVGLHRLNQKALPVTCVAAGLPSLPALVGEAKSYAERLFEKPRIDRLSKSDAIRALRDPALSRKVTFDEDALRLRFPADEGLPLFPSAVRQVRVGCCVGGLH